MTVNELYNLCKEAIDNGQGDNNVEVMISRQSSTYPSCYFYNYCTVTDKTDDDSVFLLITEDKFK